MNARERFDALRARYIAARVKQEEHYAALRFKYGGEYKDSWLRAGERNLEDRLSAAVDKAGDALFAHVQAISPRDWSVGVPVSWVLEDLTFEDAERPVGEPLSVVPPLSYGSTRPMT